MYTPQSPHAPLCFPVTKMVRYRAKKYGHLSGELAMMKELLNGPITCGIACSNGFSYDYKAGIFEDTTGFMDIDHDVEIVGWGEEDGVKYWHVRNSWGTYWGMNGFFKIVRGKNNLGIEADCAFVEPDISEQELVWEEKPTYGGSIFGIVPFNDTAAATHPIEDSTSDVTVPDSAPSKDTAAAMRMMTTTMAPREHGVSVADAVLFFVAGCGCTLLAAFLVFKARLRHVVYRSIN
jgi:cathepsin X